MNNGVRPNFSDAEISAIKRKLDDFSIPEPNSGCWLWTKATKQGGYGQVWFNEEKYLAHRLSYFVYKGDIDKNKELDHLCRTHCCINPDHLEEVIHQTNMDRRVWEAPKNYKTHCPHGHEYTEENSIFPGGGLRRCRECARIRVRAAYRKKKGKKL
jgi:hypothetical protein